MKGHCPARIGIYLFVVGSMIFSAMGCGTEAGNPKKSTAEMVKGTPAVDTADESTSPSSLNRVMTAMCKKLTACFSQARLEECQAAVLYSTTLQTRLGAGAHKYNSFQELLTADVAGNLNVSVARLDQCIFDIEALSCNASSVQYAYSDVIPTDFTEVDSLASTNLNSCAGVVP